MWQTAGKIIKPSSVFLLLWFIFWRKACLIVSRKYQEVCFVTHTNGPYFDAVARHAWSKDSNSYAGGSAATGSLPCRTGQRRWPRWKRIPWSSRLVAGRETDSLIEKPSMIPPMGLQNRRRSGCKEKDFDFWYMEAWTLFKTVEFISLFSKLKQQRLNLTALEKKGSWKRWDVDREEWRRLLRDPRPRRGYSAIPRWDVDRE
jgi:hypothetical protein